MCPKCKTVADPLRVKRLLLKLKSFWFHKNGRLEITDEIRFANLKWRIDKLTAVAWRSDNRDGNLMLSPNCTTNLSVEQTIKSMLAHIGQVASGFNVPIRVPRVERTRLTSEAGQFVVQDGWVSIVLSEELITNGRAVRAVLAHELCHYVLNNAGIREEVTETNEKLTDLCMFVTGLGEIFLHGYKDEIVHKEYRTGHRLGYLSDAEYQFARRYVESNWKAQMRVDPIEKLRKEITGRVNDSSVTRRLVADYRRRFPSKCDLEVYQGVLESLDRR